MNKENETSDKQQKGNDFIADVVGSTSKCFLINNTNKKEDVSDNLWRCVKCKREIHIMNRLGKDDLCN